MCLPYWNSELDVEVGCWSFSRREHGTISMAGLHSELLRDLSFQALSLDSELLYLCGSECGIAGSMIWDESVLERRTAANMSPFTLVFGYSREMERFSGHFLARRRDLKAGVTECTFWNGQIALIRYKVIAYMAALPVFNELEGLVEMRAALQKWKKGSALVPFYAERFGFLRAPLPYETDIPEDMLVVNKLENFQLDETRSVIGPSPSIPLPAFYELTIGDDGEET